MLNEGLPRCPTYLLRGIRSLRYRDYISEREKETATFALFLSRLRSDGYRSGELCVGKLICQGKLAAILTVLVTKPVIGLSKLISSSPTVAKQLESRNRLVSQ